MVYLLNKFKTVLSSYDTTLIFKKISSWKTQERRYEPSKQVLVFQILSVANCFKPLCDNSGRCFCKNAEMATGKTNIQILGEIYVYVPGLSEGLKIWGGGGEEQAVIDGPLMEHILQAEAHFVLSKRFGFSVFFVPKRTIAMEGRRLLGFKAFMHHTLYVQMQFLPFLGIICRCRSSFRHMHFVAW